MLIKIKTSEGKTIEIDVEPSDSIEAVKGIIQDKTAISFDSMDLYFNDKQLENGQTLADYGVQKEMTLNLIIEAQEPEKFLQLK